MHDNQLAPATHEDLVHSIAYALRFNRSGGRVSDWDLVMAHAAAEHLAHALQLAGFVVTKAAPRPAQSETSLGSCSPVCPGVLGISPARSFHPSERRPRSQAAKIESKEQGRTGLPSAACPTVSTYRKRGTGSRQKTLVASRLPLATRTCDASPNCFGGSNFGSDFQFAIGVGPIAFLRVVKSRVLPVHRRPASSRPDPRR